MQRANSKFGLGTHEIATDEPCGLDVDSLKLKLLALLRAAEYKPPLLPAVAKIWNLPPDIAVVLSLHHRLALDGHVHPSAAVVAVADGLAEEFGFGFHAETNPLQTESAARLLGLDEPGLSRLRSAAEELAKART